MISPMTRGCLTYESTFPSTRVMMSVRNTWMRKQGSGCKTQDAVISRCHYRDAETGRTLDGGSSKTNTMAGLGGEGRWWANDSDEKESVVNEQIGMAWWATKPVIQLRTMPCVTAAYRRWKMTQGGQVS